jgi:D-alanyl-D-alanine carboxypeptidase
MTLQDVLSAWRADAGVPGVSAAVRVNGQLHWSSTPSDDGVLNGDAVFPIYSITKTLTAICALRLAEADRWSLDDPVRKWVPDVPLPRAVTLSHLLRHTSGLRDYGPLAEYHRAVRFTPREPWTRRQFLDAVLSRDMLFAPGEGWAYSNVGYLLIRESLQGATNQTFAQAIQNMIVAPLGLTRTRVIETIDDWADCVPGYGPEVDAEGRSVDVRHSYDPRWVAPGVVMSTAEEITLALDGLFAGRLLKPRTLAEMLVLTPIPAPDSPPQHGYGLGIASDLESAHGANFGHGGGGPGYGLTASVFPETPLGRVATAVFVNTSPAEYATMECEAQLVASLLNEGR